MDISVFLAQAFGLYFVITSLAMLFKRQRLMLIVDELVASPANIFIIAIMTLILGILLILVHNIWVSDWRVIITLLAWMTFVAGLIRTFIPETIVEAATSFRNDTVYYTMTIVTLLVGLYLCYHGFYA